MIEVFGFITWRSIVNRLTRRVRRLREPRYLLPFIVSILWFGSALFRPFARHGMHGRVVMFGPDMFPPDTAQALVFVAGVGIFAWVAMLWLLPSKTAELVFSPAEIHFLFTAPLTRKQIVQYKLARAQVGIILGAFIGALVFGARLGTLGGWARVVAFWLFFAIGYLHGIAASFVRTDLMQSGWSGVRRRGVTLAVVAALVGAVVVSARDSWAGIAAAASSLITAGGADDKMARLGDLTHVLAVAGTTGVAGVILWPFLVLPRLLFARNVQEFASAGAVGLGLLVVHYLWVMRTDASFEEASVELSQKTANRRQARLEMARTGGILVKSARSFAWKLSPTGRPAVALIWKNLVNLTRVTPVRALIGLSALLLALTSWMINIASLRASLWLVATVVAAFIAAFTCVLGPVFVRNDLREDLFRIDALRTFPLAGHAIVLAEVLGAWVVLAFIQEGMILFAAFAFRMSGAPALFDLPAPWIVGGFACAVVVLPAFALVAVTLQNGLVVLFPAWVQLGNSRARGFEASGQRILTLFGGMFVLAVVAVPAVASGGVLSWVLAHALGPWCLVPGGLVAAAWMALEVVVGCRLLGRVLDRIDPSTAGIEAQEA